MSPRILILPFIEPIHSARLIGCLGGTISATGFPCRVSRSGCRVRRTCSSNCGHFALNSEIATCFLRDPYMVRLQTVGRIMIKFGSPRATPLRAGLKTSPRL